VLSKIRYSWHATQPSILPRHQNGLVTHYKDFADERMAVSDGKKRGLGQPSITFHWEYSRAMPAMLGTMARSKSGRCGLKGFRTMRFTDDVSIRKKPQRLEIRLRMISSIRL